MRKCEGCGKGYVEVRRKQRFCEEGCRMKWWKEEKEEVREYVRWHIMRCVCERCSGMREERKREMMKYVKGERR